MNAQIELGNAPTGGHVDTDAEQRQFANAPLDDIRRELKHHGVNVEEITTSLRTYLARRMAELAPRPDARPCSHSAERVYLDALPTVERIAALVARRNRLSRDEVEEFTSVVRMRLFENDYAIIRKFEGRSAFTTYLTVVIVGLYRQYHIQQYGKWRPSAEARRLGDNAILLERMMTRDGYSFHEAVNVLTIRDGSGFAPGELEAIYARLPPRHARRHVVADDDLPDIPALDSADDRVQERDRALNARLAAAAIDTVLRELGPEDQVILQLRFWQGRKVPDIARLLHIDQKKLYKRFDRLLSRLRQALENAGIDRSIVADLLDHGSPDLPLSSMPERMQSASGVKRPA